MNAPQLVTPRMDPKPMRRPPAPSPRPPTRPLDARSEFARRHPAHPANHYPPPPIRIDELRGKLAASTAPDGSAKLGYRQRVRVIRALINQSSTGRPAP
jgi:hypothetical protein